MNKKQGFLLFFLVFFLVGVCLAQSPEELEFNIDLNSLAVPIPKIYKPNIDLSGRGAHRDITWPQTLAAKDVLEKLQTDLGFAGLYRIQYNLWEIEQLAQDKTAQANLLNNYETIIKKISDSGGTVILNLFGTPSGLGRVLDKNSPPHNLKAYKELVKNTIRKLSCNKKYNIWYEVWNAPDLEDFFLGERSEYLNLYRIVGEAVKELRLETKIHIPLGGPSVSSWFANTQPNDILYPERSLIYELIKYCNNYRLPLDFISWHAYSSDPKLEKQGTIYQKSFIKLIREWLKYFNFSSSLPLVIDEWNFDGPANMLKERGRNSFVAASFIPAHLKNMYEAGVDYQTYFSLEDFADNKEGVNRNLGVFGFDTERIDSKGYAKASYNTLRMLNLLGNELLPSPSGDDFVGLITTKSADYLAVLIYNYIDPQVALNYLSRNIVYLNRTEKKSVLDIVKSDRIEKILSGGLSLSTLRLTPKVKDMFSQAIELNTLAKKFSAANRKIKVSFKGRKDLYMLSQYTVSSKCNRDCEFSEGEQKEVDLNQGYLATLELSPYSVQLLVFKKKPPEPVVPVVEVNPDTVKKVVKDAEKP
ncbi:MAG: hypothetical protein L6308_03480 [Candidatus Omnitrophica bacterium]|nr:hypothetical protein [Candidatus Omnitrophota bacterium]